MLMFTPSIADLWASRAPVYDWPDWYLEIIGCPTDTSVELTREQRIGDFLAEHPKARYEVTLAGLCADAFGDGDPRRLQAEAA